MCIDFLMFLFSFVLVELIHYKSEKFIHKYKEFTVIYQELLACSNVVKLKFDISICMSKFLGDQYRITKKLQHDLNETEKEKIYMKRQKSKENK